MLASGAPVQKLHTIFNRARTDDRQVNELLGLSQGLIADGIINQQEIEFLQKWLVAKAAVQSNPIVGNLLKRIEAMLSDGVLDLDESKELFETLERFSGGDFELGELQKSTSLPFEHPLPPVSFSNQQFCFTGTFAYGARKDCEAAIAARGGACGSISRSTNYLVIGIYATDSWAHSSYGRKIEKAVELRAAGTRLKIIGEAHWVEAL